MQDQDEYWMERKKINGTVRKGRDNLQTAANEEGVLEINAPAVCPGLTEAPPSLGLPPGLGCWACTRQQRGSVRMNQAMVGGESPTPWSCTMDNQSDREPCSEQ